MEGVGCSWDNIAYSPLEGDGFSLLTVIVMMAADCVFYALLVWYVERICPGTHGGLPLPWYFPASPAYWMDASAGMRPTVDAGEPGNGAQQLTLCERILCCFGEFFCWIFYFKNLCCFVEFRCVKWVYAVVLSLLIVLCCGDHLKI